jgi:hypothetical protein
VLGKSWVAAGTWAWARCWGSRASNSRGCREPGLTGNSDKEDLGSRGTDAWVWVLAPLASGVLALSSTPFSPRTALTPFWPGKR